MKRRNHLLPALLFLTLLLGLAMPFARRAWAIAPLYLDATLRHRTELALTQLTSRQGWLLSDLQIKEVAPSHVRLVYREHRRNPRSSACLILSLSTFETRPCEK
ncbi:MAG: hypothetical protein WCV62_02240 [Candidatus Peribacteraceae bacterium]|jgi:hypothetical protein